MNLWAENHFFGRPPELASHETQVNKERLKKMLRISFRPYNGFRIHQTRIRWIIPFGPFWKKEVQTKRYISLEALKADLISATHIRVVGHIEQKRIDSEFCIISPPFVLCKSNFPN